MTSLIVYCLLLLHKVGQETVGEEAIEEMVVVVDVETVVVAAVVEAVASNPLYFQIRSRGEYLVVKGSIFILGVQIWLTLVPKAEAPASSLRFHATAPLRPTFTVTLLRQSSLFFSLPELSSTTLACMDDELDDAIAPTCIFQPCAPLYIPSLGRACPNLRTSPWWTVIGKAETARKALETPTALLWQGAPSLERVEIGNDFRVQLYHLAVY